MCRWKPLSLNTANITIRIEAQGKAIHNNDPLKVFVSSWFIVHLLQIYYTLIYIRYTSVFSTRLFCRFHVIGFHYTDSLSLSVCISMINNDG